MDGKLEPPFRHVEFGGVQLSLSDLDGLRLSEIPYWRVEVTDCPRLTNGYGLIITIEKPTIKFTVGFDHPKTELSRDLAIAFDRRIARINRAFAPLLRHSSQYRYAGETRADWFGAWACLSNYDATLESDDDIGVIVQEFVNTFRTRLRGLSECLVFLCHASEDKVFADRIASELLEHNIPIWYDKHEIRVGDSIVDRIDEALADATHVIVLLSHSSVSKAWVKKEFAAALARQLEKRQLRVLPVLLSPCEVPTILADIHYADCRNDPTQGINFLVRSLLDEYDASVGGAA